MATRKSTTDTTSRVVASGAAKVLADKKASAAEKTLAASALAQRNPKAKTSEKVTKVAAKVLSDPKSSPAIKSIAASTLTQKSTKQK